MFDRNSDRFAVVLRLDQIGRTLLYVIIKAQKGNLEASFLYGAVTERPTTAKHFRGMPCHAVSRRAGQ